MPNDFKNYRFKSKRCSKIVTNNVNSKIFFKVAIPISIAIEDITFQKHGSTILYRLNTGNDTKMCYVDQNLFISRF